MSEHPVWLSITNNALSKTCKKYHLDGYNQFLVYSICLLNYQQWCKTSNFFGEKIKNNVQRSILDTDLDLFSFYQQDDMKWTGWVIIYLKTCKDLIQTKTQTWHKVEVFFWTDGTKSVQIARNMNSFNPPYNKVVSTIHSMVSVW